jgi:hypothetical protein
MLNNPIAVSISIDAAQRIAIAAGYAIFVFGCERDSFAYEASRPSDYRRTAACASSLPSGGTVSSSGEAGL